MLVAVSLASKPPVKLPFLPSQPTTFSHHLRLVVEESTLERSISALRTCLRVAPMELLTAAGGRSRSLSPGVKRQGPAARSEGDLAELSDSNHSPTRV